MKYELRIYANDGSVAKIYTADRFDVRMGTINAIVSILKPEELDLNDTKSIGLAIMSAWGQVTPMLIDMFPGLTSDEVENVKLSNVIEIGRQLFAYLTDELGLIGGGDKEKN